MRRFFYYLTFWNKIRLYTYTYIRFSEQEKEDCALLSTFLLDIMGQSMQSELYFDLLETSEREPFKIPVVL